MQEVILIDDADIVKYTCLSKPDLPKQLQVTFMSPSEWWKKYGLTKSFRSKSTHKAEWPILYCYVTQYMYFIINTVFMYQR